MGLGALSIIVISYNVEASDVEFLVTDVPQCEGAPPGPCILTSVYAKQVHGMDVEIKSYKVIPA